MASAQTSLFTEDFESPNVDAAAGAGFTNGTLPDNGNWVGANQGFGATRRGITDKSSGDFATTVGDIDNSQAFAFRYTNSGLTTAEGVIDVLALGPTYTVSVDVVRDDGGGMGTPYNVQLIAFAAGAARNDCRSTPAGSSVVASASGNAPGDGSFATVSFDFTPDPGIHAGLVGFDLGVRFIGATTSAIVDNVEVVRVDPPADMDPPTPDPMTFAVLPRPVSATAITMTATTAADVTGPVEYFFENTTNGNIRDWSTDTSWTNTGLTDGSTYAFRVKARDAAAALNETAFSFEEFATAEADTVAPDPDPMGFETGPFPSAPGAITMMASLATDAYPSGPVEYYLENTTTSDFRDWSTDRTWTNSGLTNGQGYGFRVKGRDALGNETAWSSTINVVALDLAILLTEDFESPDTPTGYSQGTLPDNGNWVGSNTGFNASRRGITDKAGGDFSTGDIANSQAFAFRYSNTGLTSAEAVLGSLTPGATYRVSFDAVRDDGQGGGTGYTVQLLVFDGGENRGDVDGAPSGTVLASASGSAPGDGSFATYAFEFTPNAVDDALNIGKDLGVRLKGGFSTAIVDNVRVTSAGGSSGGNDFADWIALFPGVGGQTGFFDDPDGDGNESGLENFFGTDPSQYTNGLVSGTVSGNTFTFTHPQNATAADDVSEPMYSWSTDLENFFPDGATAGPTTVNFSAATNTPAPGTTTVTATITGTIPDELFVAVSVTQAVP